MQASPRREDTYVRSMVLLPAMAGHANSACLNILSQNRSAENKPKNIFEWKNFSIVIWYESKQNSSSTFFGHSLFVKLTVICFMCYGSFSFFHLSRFCVCRLSSIVENNHLLHFFFHLFHKRFHCHPYFCCDKSLFSYTIHFRLSPTWCTNGPTMHGVATIMPFFHFLLSVNFDPLMAGSCAVNNKQ